MIQRILYAPIIITTPLIITLNIEDHKRIVIDHNQRNQIMALLDSLDILIHTKIDLMKKPMMQLKKCVNIQINVFLRDK